MHIVTLNTFASVLLYALEYKRKDTKVQSPLLDFSEIWQICDACGHNMQFPIRPLGGVDRKEFTRHVFENIRALEADGHVWRYPAEGNLVHIGLTDRGRKFLDDAVFSGQEKLNKRAWPWWLGGEKGAREG